MIGNIFAISILAMFAWAVKFMIREGARPGIWACLRGLMVMGLGIWLMVEMVPRHGCWRGGSVTPLLLGGILAGLVSMLVVSRRKRRLAVAVLMISGFGLTVWSTEFVHQTPYVGGTYIAQVYERDTRRAMDEVRERLTKLAKEQAEPLVLPAGWIDESLRQATGSDALVQGVPICHTAHLNSLWHTWFTQIYHAQEKRTGIWCAGGLLAGYVEHLEVRDRLVSRIRL